MAITGKTLRIFYIFVRSNAPITQFLRDVDIPIPWEFVTRIDLPLTSHGSPCPICLDQTYLAPRITPCGHCFCYLCILKALDYKSQCPVCMRPLSGVDMLRPARFRLFRKTPTTFMLMVQEQSSPFPVPSTVPLLSEEDIHRIQAAKVADGKAAHKAGEKDLLDVWDPYVFTERLYPSYPGSEFLRILIDTGQEQSAFCLWHDLLAIQAALPALEDAQFAEEAMHLLEKALADSVVIGEPILSWDELKLNPKDPNVIIWPSDTACNTRLAIKNIPSIDYTINSYSFVQTEHSNKKLRQSSCALFYQSIDGQFIFLDSVTMALLTVDSVYRIMEPKRRDNWLDELQVNEELLRSVHWVTPNRLAQRLAMMPVTLQNFKVVQIYKSEVNSAFRRQYGFLSFIPRSAPVIIVDCDITSDMITHPVYQKFIPFVSERRRRRAEALRRVSAVEDRLAKDALRQRQENYIASQKSASSIDSPTVNCQSLSAWSIWSDEEGLDAFPSLGPPSTPPNSMWRKKC